MISKCNICNNNFTPYRSSGKVCSEECRGKYILKSKNEYYLRTKDTKLKVYREKNKNIISEKRRKLYLKNKESENKKHKEWYQKNRETEIASAKERGRISYLKDPITWNKRNNESYYKHHEKRKAQGREYAQRENIRPKRLKRGRVYYQENREIVLERNAKWHKLHPESSLKSMKKHMRKMEIALKLPNNSYGWALQSWTKTVRKLHGNYCGICGSTDRLNSHHIFPKSIHPLLSLNKHNGIPLCKEHHLEVHRLNPMAQ